MERRLDYTREGMSDFVYNTLALTHPREEHDKIYEKIVNGK